MVFCDVACVDIVRRAVIVSSIVAMVTRRARRVYVIVVLFDGSFTSILKCIKSKSHTIQLFDI